MRWILTWGLLIVLLAGCTSVSAIDPSPTPTTGTNQGATDEAKRIADILQQEKERIERLDAEQNKGKTVQQREPEPPKVIYDSVFDIPLESLESDRVYTHRGKITFIEVVNQENPDHSIIAGMQLAYNLSMNIADRSGTKGLSLAEGDTRVFHYISDDEKRLAALDDLKVGQEIEVQYIAPLTPVSLAIEVIILSDNSEK